MSRERIKEFLNDLDSVRKFKDYFFIYSRADMCQKFNINSHEFYFIKDALSLKSEGKFDWYNDGIKDYVVYKEATYIPQDWKKGRLKGCGVSTLGKHWYNNGIESRNFFDTEVPDGWVRGSLSKSNLGYRTYNNGIENIQIKQGDEIPRGFVLGRTNNQNYIKAASKRRKIYYNNGVEEIKLLSSDKIPEGFVEGRLRKLTIKEQHQIRDNYYRNLGYIPLKDLTTKQLTAWGYYRAYEPSKVDFIHRPEVYTYINKSCLPLLDEYSKENHSKGISRSEKDVLSEIKKIYSGQIIENTKSILKDKDKNYYEIDIYIPDLKIGIEYNGSYWHSSLCKDKYYHENKSKIAEECGIRLIQIYQHEWENLELRNKIIQMLRIAFNQVENKIYARNCDIKQISNLDAKLFNEKTHLQGHRNAQVTYGLFYNSELVQLMSFSKTRYNRNLKNDNDWEIIRGCPGSNNIVVGGVSKLFSHFIKDYNPDRIFSYCDFNKFNGKSYESIGMRFIGYTGPDMKWLLKSGEVVNRKPSRHSEYREDSMAQIWGSGSKKYLWERNDEQS